MLLGNRDSFGPRSLRDFNVREERRVALHLPHIAPLAAYAATLRTRGGVQVPDFDPFDGGTLARMLFLLEKPGPAIAVTPAPGFVSRDNDTPTAEAIYIFMQRAAIPREWTVLWNVIPWWNGTCKVTGAELRDGIAEVRELIGLLPKLQVAVMVGNRAAQARPYLETTRLALFTSHHPSPNVRAALREKWEAIPSIWATAAEQVQRECSRSRSAGLS